MTTLSSKYADMHTPLGKSLLELTLQFACLPKDIVLKEDVLYRPGKIQNIL